MGDHTYTVASYGANPIDVQYIRELIVAESPALVADDTEIAVYLEHIDHPGKVLCAFTPTLTGPQVTQLDGIMSSYTGRPALSPPESLWIDEDHGTEYSTTTTYSSYHSCQLNDVTLDPGTYEISWEATGRLSTSESMRVKFTLDGTQIPKKNPYFDSNDGNDDSQYSATTLLTVTERASYELDTLFCRTWAGGYTVYLKDLVQKIRRITDDR